MSWFVGCRLILFFIAIARTATGELFNFDLSPMRSNESAEPSTIWCQPIPMSGRLAVSFCAVDNHIKLSTNGDKTNFVPMIEHIRNASANRAVALGIIKDASLVDASIIGPIGRQIVQFIITGVVQGNLTSRLPAIGLSNLLDLQFWFCPRLRIHKADFNGMDNIRCIDFAVSPPKFIEQGTFANLPTLLTLILGDHIADTHVPTMTAWQELKCDAQNARLFEFLTNRPGLHKNRHKGDIFMLGRFRSQRRNAEEPKVNCTKGADKAVQA